MGLRLDFKLNHINALNEINEIKGLGLKNKGKYTMLLHIFN